MIKDSPDAVLSKSQIYYRKVIDRKREIALQWRIRNRERCRIEAAEWRKKNPEKQKKISQKYASENREKARLKTQEWRGKNKERALKSGKDWLDRNQHIARSYGSKSRAILKGAVDCSANKKIMESIFELAWRLQKCLKIRFSVDHIVPLKLGGTHHQRNIQAMPRKLNSRKQERVFKFPLWSHPRFSLHPKDLILTEGKPLSSF